MKQSNEYICRGNYIDLEPFRETWLHLAQCQQAGQLQGCLFIYHFSLQASDIWFLGNGSWLAQDQTAEPLNDPDCNFPLGSLTSPHHH